MFNRIRDRFGTAGLIVSIVALVLALAGGAYAAAGLNSKQKSQVKAIAKQFAGKPGATGPAGPAGPAGANGKDGANGTNGTNGRDGTNGTNGQSVTVTDEAAFGNCGDATGYRLVSASGTDFVCNGLDGDKGDRGDPWTAGGTLPVGSTETGAWAFLPGASVGDVTAISFSVPLASEIGFANTHYIAKGGTPPASCDNGVAPPPSPANPEADSGHLCVYAGTGSIANDGLAVFKPSLDDFTGVGASTTGAILLAGDAVTGGGIGYFAGTWAVTG
jgi:collagen triple helix repeat protein